MSSFLALLGILLFCIPIIYYGAQFIRGILKELRHTNTKYRIRNKKKDKSREYRDLEWRIDDLESENSNLREKLSRLEIQTYNQQE